MTLAYLVPRRMRSAPAVRVDDRQLADAARRGDESAFGDLVRRHAGGLQRTVARILADENEAWDVVQMTFLKAWQSLERYDPMWSFSTWLYRIGTNLAIDLFRARGSRERAHKAGGEHRLRLVGEGESASDLATQHEVDGILSELVTLLPPQQRAAFVLRELEGKDTSEVAAVLGCSQTTVRNHVFQARKSLRREVEARFPEYLPRAGRS
jgi:RNA polymerase sigma-70 factor (ECF subfamily)